MNLAADLRVPSFTGPGTVAERAGVEIGSQVVEVNGVPAHPPSAFWLPTTVVSAGTISHHSRKLQHDNPFMAWHRHDYLVGWLSVRVVIINFRQLHCR